MSSRWMNAPDAGVKYDSHPVYPGRVAADQPDLCRERTVRSFRAFSQVALPVGYAKEDAGLPAVRLGLVLRLPGTVISVWLALAGNGAGLVWGGLFAVHHSGDGA